MTLADQRVTARLDYEATLASVSADDWLPAEFAEPDPALYSQYLLYCDPLQRFSIVSFVWGPGQRTPVHDHTVWGLIGMLRGAEISRNYVANPTGKLQCKGTLHLTPGQITAVSPQIGDIQNVGNGRHAQRRRPVPEIPTCCSDAYATRS